MIFKKESLLKSNLLKIVLLFLFFFNFSSEALPNNKLNKIRVSYDTQDNKLRIVFDASKKIEYKIKKKIKKNSLNVNFKDINISNDFKSPKLNKKYIKVLKLVRKGVMKIGILYSFGAFALCARRTGTVTCISIADALSFTGKLFRFDDATWNSVSA